MLMQYFGLTNKGHYGMLWCFLEWSMATMAFEASLKLMLRRFLEYWRQLRTEKTLPPFLKKKSTYTNHCASVPRKIQSLLLVWTILYIIAAKFQPIGTGVAKLTNHIEVWLHDLVSWKKKRVDLKISNWFKLNKLDQTFKQTLHFIKHSRGKYNS